MCKKEFRAICLPAVLGVVMAIVLFTANTVQAQILPGLFKKNSNNNPWHTLPLHLPATAKITSLYHPSESDLEAAKNVRNSLINTERTERLAQQQEAPLINIGAPDDFDVSTSQIVVETRFIDCRPPAIAPKGLLPEHGWVLLPIAQKQKPPAMLRVNDLVQAEETPIAVGAICLTEQYTPTLIRFIDTGNFGTIMKHIQEDSQSNILQTPKVTMLSGQAGTVFDITEQYCGWLNSRDEKDAEIEIVKDGIRLDILPEIAEDGSVNLKKFQATFTVMIGQDRYPLDPDNEVVLEMPKLNTRTFNLPLTIPEGKTLLVAIPQASSPREEPKIPKAQPNLLCLAVTCTVITPETIAETEQNPAAEDTTKVAQAVTDSENLRQAEEEWRQFWLSAP